MSLQQIPPESPPEKQEEIQVNMLPAPKSYLRRLIKHAYWQTKEHKKMELLASSIVAFVVGGFFGGFTLKGLIIGVVGVFAVIGLIFVCHLIFAPSALDTSLRKELSDTQLTLGAEIDSLKAEELNKRKLNFEIDTQNSAVRVHHHQETFAPPEIVPEEIDKYIIRLYLKIRFENVDENPIVVKSVVVSLLKATENETGQTIPLLGEAKLYEEYSTPEEDVIPARKHWWDDRRLSIEKRELTPYLPIEGDLVIAAQYGEELNHSYFLRVTMTAMNQSTVSLNFDVDWQTALKWDVGITPRS